MKNLLFSLFGLFTQIFVLSAQNVGINVASPQAELQVHSTTSSSTLQLSNNISSSANSRGTTLRALGGNFFLTNHETNGNISIAPQGFPGLNYMKFFGAYYLGIGTNNPNKHLHVYDASLDDVSLQLANSTTGLDKGARLRLFYNDVSLSNSSTGSLDLVTLGNSRLHINATGEIGINNTSPSATLDINPYLATNGIRIGPANNNAFGLFVDQNAINNTGVYIGNSSNSTYNSNYITGILSSVGSGAGLYTPGSQSNFGVIGQSMNLSHGVGIYGLSNSPSFDKTQGAIVARNNAAGLEDSEPTFAVVGSTQGQFGAAILGKSNYPNSPGILGLGQSNTATAIKAEIESSYSGGTALHIRNGAIKVSGGERPIFQITANTGVGGNTSGNILKIPNTTQANAATDLLIVTPVYATVGGVYVNFPIGVWFNDGFWHIFNQNGPFSIIPHGAIFNVMVVKQ